jgi:hypothetical protein
MDHVGMRILVVVAAKLGENPNRRRGSGSSTMIVSRGLVGPKVALNQKPSKGNPVNIPEPPRYLRQRKPGFRRSEIGRVRPSPHLTVETRGVP